MPHEQELSGPPLAGPPQVMPSSRRRDDPFLRLRQLGTRQEFQQGPELRSGEAFERLRKMGQPGLNASDSLSLIEPRRTTHSSEAAIRSLRTPMEQLSGQSYPVSDEEHSLLLEAGKAFAESFYFWEPGIDLRERVFRAANVGSLALPLGFVARAPMLMKAFPALRAVTATRRGQVAFAAASEGLIAGGLEAIRGPDEEGDTHVTTQILLGATLGGTLGLVTGHAARAARTAMSRKVLERFGDMDEISRATSPLFNERYAIISGGHDGFNAETQARIHAELVNQLEREGYKLMPVKLGDPLSGTGRDAVLVPGLDEELAVTLARETNAQRVFTERGMIDLDEGLVYPLERRLTKLGTGVDAQANQHMVLQTNRGPVVVQPGYNTAEPVRLGMKGPGGEFAARLDEITDQSATQGWTRRMWDSFRNLDMRSALSSFYRKSIRQVAGAEQWSRRLGQDESELLVTESTAKLAEVLKSRFGTFTEMAMQRGVPKWGSATMDSQGKLSLDYAHGRGLFDILGELQPDEMVHFERYGLARTLASIAEEFGEDALPKLGGKAVGSLDEARSYLAFSPDHFERLFDEVMEWRNAVLRETLWRGGVIDDAALDRITRTTDRVPLVSADELARVDETASDITEVFALFNPVKHLRQTGQETSFVPWTQALIQETAMRARMSDQQRVVSHMIDRAKGAVIADGDDAVAAMRVLGLEHIGTPPREVTEAGRKLLPGLEQTAEAERSLSALFTPPMAKVGDTRYVRRLVDGEPEWYKVLDEGLWDVVKSMGPVELGPWESVTRAASAPASLLRTTVTQGFDFLIKNPVRDVAFAFVNAGINPTAAARGLASLWKQDEFYEAWLASGGPRSALVSLDRPAISNMIRELGQQRLPRGQRIRNVVSSPRQWFEALRGFSEALENTTRLGAFRQTVGRLIRDEDMLPENAVLEAALLSKQVSVNFSMTGSHQAASILRGISAFWNAGVQGMDQLRRSALQDPAGFVARGAALTGISMSLYALNRQDEDYVNGIPDWEKNLFWHLRLLGNEAAEWLRIPKPFEPGILFGSLPERFMEAMDAEDPRILDDALALNLGDLGASVLPMPTVLQPILENAMNKDLLTGAPVVPRGLEDVDPDFQVGGRTSGLAINMARFLNQGAENSAEKVSPLMIDNIIEGYTGSLARFFYADVPELLADGYRVAVEGEGIAPRRAFMTGPRRVPGFRAFLSTYPYSSQPVDDLYSIGEEARIAARTASFLEETFQIDMLADYLQERSTALGLEDVVTDQLSDLAELRDQRDMVLQAPGIPTHTKRELVSKISRQMTVIARPLVKVLESQGLKP